MLARLLAILLIINILPPPISIFGQDAVDSVKVYFKQGYSKLDINLGNNKETFNRIADSLKITNADSIYILRGISVIGGASPEGSIKMNKRLSQKRANALFNYLAKYGNIPDSLKTFTYLGRDWQGLLDLVRKDPDVPYRDEVIELLRDIVDKCKDGEKRQDNNIGRISSLRNGVPYRYMYNKLFPELRASRLILYYDRVWNPISIIPLKFQSHRHQLKEKLEQIPVPPTETPFYMAVKSNLLYDAMLVPNIGAELYLGQNWSIAANWMYAWWDNSHNDIFWRIYGGDIAIRRWFGHRAKEKPLTGHHIGLYFQTLTYDFATGGRGYMGGEPGSNIFDRANYIAALEYGYSLPIAKRLNLDFAIGLGYFWGKYYEYEPKDGCYVWQATKQRHYFGPTKAEVSLVWLLGKGNVNKRIGGSR